MQNDFFEAKREFLPLTLVQHASSNYGPRTGENARGAAVTAAFAIDFTTHGEILTKKMAGLRYIAVVYGSDVSSAAAAVALKLQHQYGHSLNVAGNGIYSLSHAGVTQLQANQWVYDVLKQVHKSNPLELIRSGGQTGVDTAGLVAGLALDIPVVGLYPSGYKRRNSKKQDFESTVEVLTQELWESVKQLKR